MAGGGETIEKVLSDIGLFSLFEKFQKERIDSIATCKSLTDNELKAVGLQTIGDRVLFRERVNRSDARSHAQEPEPSKRSTGTYMKLVTSIVQF